MNESDRFDDLIFIFENDIRDHFSFLIVDGPIRKPGSSQGVKEWEMNKSTVWSIKKKTMTLRYVAEEEQDLMFP